MLLNPPYKSCTDEGALKVTLQDFLHGFKNFSDIKKCSDIDYISHNRVREMSLKNTANTTDSGEYIQQIMFNY